MKQEGRNYLYIGLGGLLLLALVVVFAYSFSSFGGCVGVVEINGEIASQDAQPTLFSGGVKGSETIASEIEAANGRPDVRSVLVLIDTPGGSVVATRDIYDALESVNKSKVAYIHEMGTSGGYYVAAGTDYIIAHPDAITGNIGARVTLSDMSGLFEKIGYNETSFKSGAMKDMGTDARPVSAGEAAVFESIVNESFTEVKDAILKSRGAKLDMPAFETALDGRLLSGRQAQKIGLVDALGSKNDAIAKAALLGGIDSDDPPLCELSSGSSGRSLLGSLTSEAVQSALQRMGVPRLSYQ